MVLSSRAHDWKLIDLDDLVPLLPLGESLCTICVAQIPPRKRVLVAHADCIRQQWARSYLRSGIDLDLR